MNNRSLLHDFNWLKERSPRTWLITGVAGFIGSNILETLLKLNQRVVGLDNFSTGLESNLQEVCENVGAALWMNFKFVSGDICNVADCQRAIDGVDIVLHQAALGSVPRSIADPLVSNHANVTGFLTILTVAKDAGVSRFVYAASSSTYGDSPALPKIEHIIGKPLSPYAVTKYVNELYADVFSKAYDIECIGLRYFNVFGQRQSPQGAYAAVIPLWFQGFLHNSDIYINGDGKTSRDFCHVDNAVQANLLAGLTDSQQAVNQVYNVAFGEQTTLYELYQMIRSNVTAHAPEAATREPTHKEFRAGDVRHSLADIAKAKSLLGYNPYYSLKQGLEVTAPWYINSLAEKS